MFNEIIFKAKKASIFKKSIALILAVLMIAATIPQLAFADDSDYVYKLEWVNTSDATISGNDATFTEEDSNEGDSFAAKYKVSLEVNKDYGVGELKIELPYYLYDYRTQYYIAQPEDWNGDYYDVLKGPEPDISSLNSDLSGTHYSASIVENEGIKKLVITNDEAVPSGTKMSGSVVYDKCNKMNTIDRTQFTIDGVLTAGTDTQTKSLTGKVTTTVASAKITKKSYSETNLSNKDYEGEIFSWSEYLGSKYGLAEEDFDEDCYYMQYEASISVAATQPNIIKITETPENGGTVIGLAYLIGQENENLALGGTTSWIKQNDGTWSETMVEPKENSSYEAGDIIPSSSNKTVHILVKYPKTQISNGRITNNIRVDVAGVDGFEEDKANATNTCTRMWLDMVEKYPGGVYGIAKAAKTDATSALIYKDALEEVFALGASKGYSSIGGGLSLLKKTDLPFNFYIRAVGNVFAYGGLKTDKDLLTDLPHTMEVIDDFMYLNNYDGAGGFIRLESGDYEYNSVKVTIKHTTVESINGDGTVGQSKEKDTLNELKVYIMKEGTTDWILYKTLATPEKETTIDLTGSEAYRIKAVYGGLTKEDWVTIDLAVSGKIKYQGTNVKTAVATATENEVDQMDLLNEAALRVYDKDNKWILEADDEAYDSANAGLADDLRAWDADSYENGEADKYSVRAHSKDTITTVNVEVGAGKETGYSKFAGIGKPNDEFELGSPNADSLMYTWELMTQEMSWSKPQTSGEAGYDGNEKQDKATIDTLTESGVLSGATTCTFYDLLPEGFTYYAWTSTRTDGASFSNYQFGRDANSGNFTQQFGKVDWMYSPISFSRNLNGAWPSWYWINVPGKGWQRNDFAIESVNAEITNNYKGTGRQMVKLTVNYAEPPCTMIRMDENTSGSSNIVKGVGYQYGIYIQAYSTTKNLTYTPNFTNNFAAQFMDEDTPITYTTDQNANKDDGAYFPSLSDAFKDLNDDGDTVAINTVYSSYAASYKATGGSGSGILKQVKADDSNAGYGVLAKVERDKTYTYRLGFSLNTAKASDLVIYDTIENAFGSNEHWQGTLLGVDLSSLDSISTDINKCPKAVVYVNESAVTDAQYLTTDTGYAGLVPSDLTTANGWKLINPDTYTGWNKVKSIAFDLRKCNDGTDFSISSADDYQGVSVELKMKAPEKIPENQTAENTIYAYNNIYYYSKNTTNDSQVTVGTVRGNTVKVYLGDPVTAVLKGTKTLKSDGDDATASIKKDQFTFTFTEDKNNPKNGVAYESNQAGTAAGGGFEFSKMTFSKLGTYTFVVEETQGAAKGYTYDSNKITASITISYDSDGYLTKGEWSFKKNDAAAELTFANTYTTPEPDPGSLIIRKTVTGNLADKTKDFHFKIDFTGLKDGAVLEVQKGESKTAFTNGGEVTLKDGEFATITGITANAKYKVTETEANADGYTTTPSGNEGTIAEGKTSTTAFTNHKGTTVIPGPTYTNVYVTKEWSDGGSTERPLNVIAVLYKNGKAYDKVMLSQENDWSNTWSLLDASYSWTIDEESVPEGYEKKLSNIGNKWTISNTLKKTDIEVPKEPDKPDKPDKPNKPGQNTDIDTPTDVSGIPKTGDSNLIMLWIALMLAAIVGAGGMAVYKKKKLDK